MPDLTILTLREGTDFQKALTLSDNDEVAFDLTGHTLSSQIRSGPGKALLGTFTVDVVTAVDGEITLRLTDTQVDAIPEGIYFADIKIVRDADSRVSRSERLQVNKEMTITE